MEIFVSSDDQLWRLNDDKLDNKNGHCTVLWKRDWSLPNMVGYIENQDTIIKKHSHSSSNGDKTHESILKNKTEIGDQKWIMAFLDEEGWCTVRTQESGLFLTATIAGELTAEGYTIKYSILFYLLKVICFLFCRSRYKMHQTSSGAQGSDSLYDMLSKCTNKYEAG